VKIVFIADFFANQVNGGGELNNSVLVDLLRLEGHEVSCINSHLVSEFNILSSDAIVVSNFINLSEQNKQTLQGKKYVIYEHDHKYLRNRNPAMYKNFKAPSEAIVNYEFYKKAKAVFCQSKFHSDIIKKNLEMDNIVSVGGNLWAEDTLNSLRLLSKNKKSDRCSVMHSDIPHKGMDHAKFYCEKNNLEYDLIMPCGHSEFLKKLGANNTLVFFPKTPETLSRIIVEARMMNLKVVTNSLVGATSEPWFAEKGEKLVDIIENKRSEIPSMVLEAIK
tara:strand:- start:246 stop:1076 length:831 start_codon:yes stop_codon:yes gene_type:complete